MVSQAQTLAIIGMITGVFVSGWTADRFVSQRVFRKYKSANHDQ